MSETFGKFSEIKYVRPDFKAVKKELNAAIKAMKSAKTYAEFKKAYEACEVTMSNVFTMTTVAEVRNTLDMNDKFYDEEQQYLNKASGGISMAMLNLTKAVLKSPFKQEISEDYGEFLLKDLEMSQKTMSPWIILLTIKQGTLTQKYSKAAAMCQTDFRGEKCNFYGLLKHMQSTDRAERKEAFDAWAKLYESVSAELDGIYDELVKVRVKIAKRLKFADFIDYIYVARGRYDYDKKDAAAFRESVRKYIVPLCQKLYKKQEVALGVDKLRFYDEELTFKEGNATPVGTTEELVEKARKMYNALSNESGEYFNFMCEHELFDLETRPGKHMGGYCTYLMDYKAPFIFSNFNGTSADVDVLTHESGHAFQAYLAFRHIKNLLQISSTSEINEIHSMSMEHFAYPYMESFFENADKYRYHHLVKAVETIPYLVSVDEFQHRVFENPKMTAKERRAAWKAIEEKYLPWRDYDGNAFMGEGGFWMQKQHIFLYPFYYIDYALAQVCAFQIFLRDRENHATAWNDYIALCRAGGTKGYFDLLKVANLDNPFHEETIKAVAGKVEKVIDEFAKKI